jgi:hypothetical protein
VDRQNTASSLQFSGGTPIMRIRCGQPLDSAVSGLAGALQIDE